MRIDGLWYPCDDGIIRPVLAGEVLAGDGSWVKAPFLLDTGADRTVLSADVLRALGLPPAPAAEQLGGVGGLAQSVLVDTQVRVSREDGTKVLFRGPVAAFPQAGALDMSVLGRDLTCHFAVIIDRPGNVVCLLAPAHSYSIRHG
jgi:Aspartyl protease